MALQTLAQSGLSTELVVARAEVRYKKNIHLYKRNIYVIAVLLCCFVGPKPRLDQTYVGYPFGL